MTDSTSNPADPPPAASAPDGTKPEGAAPFEETIAQDTESIEAVRDRIERQAAEPPSLEGYNVLRSIGRGTFGAVWLAEQTNTGRRVAIKQYDRRQADWPLMAREVEKLAALDSARNIVRLVEVSWDSPQPWFVMELLTGGSLADALREGPLPVETAVRLAREIARGLRQAHGVGVLHCDLKPGNILLDHDSVDQAEARLCDFGQARLATEESPTLGTLYYMAPEQTVANARPDARWDVYAFGAVLHQMLTGKPPHRTAESEAELATTARSERLDSYRRLAEQPAPKVEGIDRDLAEIVADCLEPNPADRIPNAQALLDRFERRERKQQRRPLMLLGLLAPLLFSAVMLVVAFKAIPQAVRQSETTLAQQTLDGNRLSARLLAAGLQQDIDVRMAELADISRREEIVEAYRTAADGDATELQTLLTRQESRSQATLVASQRRPDTSWFANDAAGYQIARYPTGTKTIGKRYHWRDYYHGLGSRYTAGTVPDDIAIRQTAGLSEPYLSQQTGHYMVALTVPVRDGDRVIGILSRTVHLYAILDSWEKRLQNENSATERLLSLASADGDTLDRLYDHRWMTRQVVNRQDDKELAALMTYPPGTPVFATESDYVDPIGAVDAEYDVPWLAAAAPVGDTGWIAIVQERRGPVLAPVQQMRDVFGRWGAVLLALFSGLLIGVWLLLIRFASA